VDFRKTFYILPNLFTLSSLMCGFVSLALAAEAEPGSRGLYLAALAICYGFFFDTADGRVARLTKTQSDLGRDLDSLSDLVTFGVAPAFLVYRWALEPYGRLGIFIAGIYVCAGALRLARFNVLSRREEAAGQTKPGKYTLGLTIPTSTAVLVFLVIVTHNLGQYRAQAQRSIAALVIVLSVLMVSRVRFRSFKDVQWNRRMMGVLLAVAGLYVAIHVGGLGRGFIFLALISLYIGLGLTEEVLFFRRRRREARSADKPRDEDVLRELGAFDEAEAADENQAPGLAAGGGSPALADGPPSSTSTKIP